MPNVPFLRRHPSFRKLSEYVDLGESQPDWKQLRLHLRSCTRCRDEVAWLRRLAEEANKLGPMPPPEGTLDRILERRARGERVILPTHGALETDGWSPSTPIWAVALLTGGLAVLAASLLLVPDASAGDNNLSFEPRHPRAGDVLEVRYRATTGLRGADSLRLRAHFRPAAREINDDDLPGARVEVTLLPDEDGVFEGRLAIPPLAAYGQIAIEDHQASHVDTNDGRLWEIRTHDEDGERYEGLRQRLRAAQGVDWRRMLETTLTMTDRFPVNPEAWYARLAVERQLLGRAADDSLLAIHREALHGIQAAAATGDLEASQMTALTEYAGAVGDAETAAYWRRILERYAPRHPGLMRLRAFDLVTSDAAAEEKLAGIDNLWIASDRGEATVARLAFDLAVELEDTERAEVWAERWDGLEPGWKSYIGRRLASMEATLPRAVTYLRAATGKAAARPLDLTAEEWVFQERERRQEIMVVLAHALVAVSALDEVKSLVQQARRDLDPRYAADFGEIMLSLSDSVAAVHLLAMAAADPIAGEEVIRSGRELARSVGVDEGDWSELTTAYRHRMRTETIQRAAYRVLRPEITVLTESGREVAFRSLADGRPMLVELRAVFSGTSIRLLVGQFSVAHEKVERLGYQFVAVVTPWKAYDIERAAFGGLAFPLYVDELNIVAPSLNLWRGTAYVVLDADGVFRGAFQGLDDALRLLGFLPPAALAA